MAVSQQQREQQRAPKSARGSGGTTTRAAAGIDTKTALLDAALRVFEKSGFAGYTVHAVVAASEISLGSLYHHFGSMDGLSSALYSRCMASLLDHIGDALEAKPQSSARQVITTIPRAYLEWTAKEKIASNFIHTAPAERFLPLHAEQVMRDKAPRLERIVNAIRPWVKKKDIAPIPEPLMEMLIIGPVAEVARRLVFGAPGLNLEDAKRVLPERIWCAVKSSK